MRFLFVDRILKSIPGEMIQGIKHVTLDDHYLSLDESARLYFTSSFIGESLGQLAAWNVMEHLQFEKRPVAGIVASAKLFRSVYVGETLLLESFIDSLDDRAVQYHSIAYVGDEVVFTIDGALGPLLPMTNFIDKDEVSRQYAAINRPGVWRNSPEPTVDFVGASSHVTKTSLTFDAIVQSEPGVQLSAIKRINQAASYFPDHFPRKPVLPMTVLLECKLNLAREFMRLADNSASWKISEMRRIKMNEFVYPGDVVMCRMTVKQQDPQELILSFRSEVEGKRVCVMDLVLRLI